MAFSVVKSVLNEHTVAKIRIFKRERNMWQPALLGNIAPHQLPRQYGGTLEDPDGNPRYTTKVSQKTFA